MLNNPDFAIAWLPAAVAGVSAVGSWLTGRKNRKSQEKTNQQAIEQSERAHEREKQTNVEFWNMQNAYNDPSAQMQRYQDAGLNPHLIYGQGNEAGSISPASAPTPNLRAPEHENPLGSSADSMFMYMNMQQQAANIRKTQAETALIDANSEHRQFDNNLREAVGLTAYRDQEYNEQEMSRVDNDLRQLGYSKDLAEFNAWSAVNFQGKPTTSTDSPLAKAMAAGLQAVHVKLSNDRKLLQIRDAEAEIKRFEVNLTRQGISPNSPWYTKILSTLIESITGYSLGNINSLNN